MTKQQIAAEALDRVLSSTSTRNFPAIYGEFMARGIAESDILPRVNVFTYAAWQAKGRQVRKGEKGVRVVTFKPCKKRRDDGSEETYRTPSASTVFHITQTDPIQ